MITHPHDASLVLFDPADVEADPAAHPLIGEYRADLRAVAEWARAYLCLAAPGAGLGSGRCARTRRRRWTAAPSGWPSSRAAATPSSR
ncbi:hypothetical protein ACFSTC_39840 [Nonomuraea ferruginea]